MSQAPWSRSEMISALHQKTALSLKQCAHVIEEIMDLIKEGLIQEGEVKIFGFGTFRVYDRKARLGRNPRTMEEKVITARKVIRFKQSSLLNKSLQGSLK